MKKNIFYAQSGGVTSVINCSAYGLFKEVKKNIPDANIFIGKNGISGLLSDEIYDLTLSKKSLSLLLDSPGAMFGSSRYKLPDLNDKAFYEFLFKKLDNMSIRYFFYNGGNDSADTCLKIHEASIMVGYDLISIAIPKTVDNDLVITDNCPGFGSVAKYVATSSKEASLDLKSMCKTSTKVFVFEVMGRNTGWIAASSELANQEDNIHVNRILLPEVNFQKDLFLQGVSDDIDQYGCSVIVVSEGLKRADGSFFSESKDFDSFGHMQLGGVGPRISSIISNELKLKCHCSVADYLQRSSRHLSSSVDVEQAIQVGKKASQMALEGMSGSMPIIVRRNNFPYIWEISDADLNLIANQEKIVPKEFIEEDKFRINNYGKDYLLPLIQGESYPKFLKGLPQYDQLDLHLYRHNNDS